MRSAILLASVLIAGHINPGHKETDGVVIFIFLALVIFFLMDLYELERAN